MLKKTSILKQISQNKKRQVLFFLFSMFCVICSYYILSKVVAFASQRNFQISKNDFSWISHVDSLKEEDGNISISGWTFKLNANAVANSYDIVLQDLETKSCFFPTMKYTIREDINEYYLCDYNYADSGFTADISKDKIEEQHVYEILIKPKSLHIAYESGFYIFEGKLFGMNPQEFVPLDVQGTELENIVQNGILEVFRRDIGMYIYQHEGFLYWIADENYYFEEDKSTYIEYQLWTTQTDKLPYVRLENNWLFDNIGFVFENNEVQELNVKKYRVARAAIPTEYAICKIETGYYLDNEWVWVEHFLPYLD